MPKPGSCTGSVELMKEGKWLGTIEGLSFPATLQLELLGDIFLPSE
jgi:hypothetical protein